MKAAKSGALKRRSTTSGRTARALRRAGKSAAVLDQLLFELKEKLSRVNDLAAVQAQVLRSVDDALKDQRPNFFTIEQAANRVGMEAAEVERLVRIALVNTSGVKRIWSGSMEDLQDWAASRRERVHASLRRSLLNIKPKTAPRLLPKHLRPKAPTDV